MLSTGHFYEPLRYSGTLAKSREPDGSPVEGFGNIRPVQPLLKGANWPGRSFFYGSSMLCYYLTKLKKSK